MKQKIPVHIDIYAPQGFFGKRKMRLIGIEPTHAAPEATALSTELQAHLLDHTRIVPILQVFFNFFTIGCYSGIFNSLI